MSNGNGSGDGYGDKGSGYGDKGSGFGDCLGDGGDNGSYEGCGHG